MANRTDTQADTVHGGNPQYLVDRIVRVKIYNDAYWKEHCFALTNETLIDRAAELDYVAGTFGGRRKPAKFLCLMLKMLQIQPDDDVIMEYIKQPDLKYLRALGIVYLRLTGRAKIIFETLEPLYADYRKLRYRNMQGKLSIIHMDELVDWCFNEEQIVDITMPQLPKREVLEFSDMLAPRQSVLEDDLEDLEELEAAHNPQKKSPSRSPSPAAVAAPAEVPEAPEDTKDAPDRSATPQRSNARDSPPARRRSRSARSGRQRSRSKRQRSRSQRRQPARRRSHSRQGSEGSRDRDRKKEKARKEKERERERERSVDREKEKKSKKERERSVERDEERLARLEKKEKKDKKEKNDAEEKAGKSKKEKKEKKPKEDAEEAPAKHDRHAVAEPKKKKGLFKGDEPKGGKERGEKEGKNKKEKDGLSVDAWNDVRKELGLKPLAG